MRVSGKSTVFGVKPEGKKFMQKNNDFLQLFLEEIVKGTLPNFKSVN